MSLMSIPRSIQIAMMGTAAAAMGLILSSTVTESASSQQTRLPPNTLCTKDERVIFSCALKRPAKVVSICASKDLTRESGYLQYRFGLPGRTELEFPQGRTGTQTKFDYSHYFRAQVDLTEINFTIDGVEYSVVDDYNGEEKPPQTLQGVTINWPGTEKKEVRYTCRTKPKTDYADLQAVLDEEH